MILLMLVLLWIPQDSVQSLVPEPVTSFREGIQALVFPDLGPMEEQVQLQIVKLHEELVSAIRRVPLDPMAVRDGYMKLGRTFHAYKRYHLAEICYANAAILSPDRFETVYLQADLARLQGQGARAEKIYHRAAELLPTYYPVYVRLGDLALAEHRLDDAFAFYSEALRREPIEASAYFGLGQVAFERRDFDLAITHFEKTLSYVSEADRVHYLLGMAWRNKGDTAKAKQHLAQAGKRGVKVGDQIANNLIRFVESGRVHIARGKAAFGAKDYNGAAREFSQAVAALPRDVGARINLGAALAALGDRDQAMQVFQTAVDLDPNDKTANFNLAILALEVGKTDLALASFQQTVTADPKDTVARLQLGKLLKAKGDLQEAFRHLNLVAQLEPKNEEVLTQRASVLIQAGRYGQALAALEQDLKQNPGSGRLTHIYARLLAACPDKSLRNGRLAMDLATRVTDVSPTAEHLETLAMAFAEAGDCNRAIEIQLRALEAARKAERVDQQTRMEKDLTRYRKGAPCRLE